MQSKAGALFILSACEVAVMALWFSASAVVPSLTAEYGLSTTQASLYTSAVQVGFVIGAFLSATLGLADRIDPRRFFMVSAITAAAANGVILLVEPTSAVVIVMRFITGACMAGVYPIGMKMAGSWAKGDLGMLVAILVGALTLGSASPHLLNAFGGVDWRFTIAASSVIALAAGLLINLVTLGPNMAKSPAINLRDLFRALAAPSIRLANLGYLGHMWELYAMLAWIGVFLDASFRISGGADPAFWARVVAFLVIGGGGVIGCLAGGYFADRHGRTTITMTAMGISGTCAIIVGFMFGAPPILLALVCIVWGVAVVADSAQFSASIAELSKPGLVGTMLTMQTCAGFLLTILTIHLIPAHRRRRGLAMGLRGPQPGALSRRCRHGPLARPPGCHQTSRR
ncbi:MAG: MFS transporter [Alphaproteobacteria bacterium]